MTQHAQLSDPGDRASFHLAGGRVDATLMPDGTVLLYGIAVANPRTVGDRLILTPESSNVLRVTLAPVDGAL